MSLYDSSGDVLHSRNPFSDKDPFVKLKYSVNEFVARINALLAVHIMHLVDGSVWLVMVPGHWPIHLVSAR